jgi:kynurenine 3-monooxygenase
MEIAVVGGGLCGPLAGLFLARHGHQVTLYERRPDPRVHGAVGGRSINLALSARGIDALERLGLAEEILSQVLPMRGRTMHATDGTQAFQSYSADGTKAINSVSRGMLNEVLLDHALAEPGITVLFEHQIVGAAEDGTLDISTPAGQISRQHQAVIGTDGAYSAIRDRIVRSAHTAFTQEPLPWGYKELSIPAAADGTWALDPDSLHIWPRRHSMMIALPNLDRSFTATLFWPHTGEHGFAGLGDAATILDRFRAEYPDAMAVMPNLVDDYLDNPVGPLSTVRLWPWTLGRLAVIGDAAHAVVPFYGQGMNCAFEDVVELDRCLGETGDDVLAALQLCSERRKPNADAIADLALDNFVEMRDRAGSPWFRLATRAEHRLERAMPDRFMSLYELVSFTTVPYSEARNRGRRRRKLVGAAVSALDAISEPILRRGSH